MLGYIRTSDTSPTGLRCPCTPHPAFFLRTSCLKTVQTVWPRWLNQPWPPLWISHLRVTGPYVESEPCVITWTGPQTWGGTRSWSLSPSRKDLTRTSHLPLSPHGSSRLWSYVMSSDQEALTLHQVKANDVRAFVASKVFQSGVSLEQILSAWHWKSHNTSTLFCLKDVAWADSKLFHLGPVVAAQQVHRQTPKWDVYICIYCIYLVYGT